MDWVKGKYNSNHSQQIKALPQIKIMVYTNYKKPNETNTLYMYG